MALRRLLCCAVSDKTDARRQKPLQLCYATGGPTPESGVKMELFRSFNLHTRPLLREFLAELLGTFLLMVFGIGAVAQAVLSHFTLGSHMSIYWGWGLAVAIGVSSCVGVTGGHINPAVTLTMAVLGRFSWIKVPVYMCAQYSGSFIASAICFLVYKDALDNFDGGVRKVSGHNATAGIWATYPQKYVSVWTAFGDQILGTALLLVGIMVLTDSRHSKGKNSHLVPFYVGGLIAVICMAFGLNCGCPLNPARDLAPRIFTAIAGWGLETFSFRSYTWFWVPVVGPHVGAILGAFIYQFAVGLHWPPDNVDSPLKLSEINITSDNSFKAGNNSQQVESAATAE